MKEFVISVGVLQTGGWGTGEKIKMAYQLPATEYTESRATHHLPLLELHMKCELGLRNWAALIYVLLLLFDSPTLSMAFCVHQSRHFRSSGSYSLRNQQAIVAAAAASSVSDIVTSPMAIRKSLRRGRAASSMLHSETYGGSASTSSHLKLPALPTAMDRVLPFGRCVGVALPAAMTDDVLRAAEDELLPEEMAYCLRLPKTLQVNEADGAGADDSKIARRGCFADYVSRASMIQQHNHPPVLLLYHLILERCINDLHCCSPV